MVGRGLAWYDIALQRFDCNFGEAGESWRCLLWGQDGMTWCDMVRSCRYGMVWSGKIWHGIIWSCVYGMVLYQDELLQLDCNVGEAPES